MKKFRSILLVILMILFIISCSNNFVREKRQNLLIKQNLRKIEQKYGKNYFNLSKFNIDKEQIKWTLEVKFKEKIKFEEAKEIIELNNCKIYKYSEYYNKYKIMTPGEINFKNVAEYYDKFKKNEEVEILDNVKEVYISRFLPYSLSHNYPIVSNELEIVFKKNISMERKKNVITKYNLEITYYSNKNDLESSILIYSRFKKKENYIEIYLNLLDENIIDEVLPVIYIEITKNSINEPSYINGAQWYLKDNFGPYCSNNDIQYEE